jgi:hypothetical protein
VHAVSFGDDISDHSAGEATDWIWNTQRTVAFTPEVRPRACLLDPNPPCTVPAGHSGGFAPAETHILPKRQEQCPAVRALIHDAARTGLWTKGHPDDDGSEPSARPTPRWVVAAVFGRVPTSGPIRSTCGAAKSPVFVRGRNETGVSQSVPRPAALRLSTTAEAPAPARRRDRRDRPRRRTRS